MLETEPFLSVVMPSYNAESFIEETLHSVKCQTFQDFEVIIVDDASTDLTAELVTPFLSDSRFRLIRRPANGGVAAALNTGIGTASGEWLAFLGADDLWMPEKLEKQVALAREHSDAALIFSNGFEFNEFGDLRPFYSERRKFPEGYTLARLLDRNCYWASSVMVKRQDVLSVGLFDENVSIGEDYFVWAKILARGGKAEGIWEPIVRYRKHGNSLTTDKLSAYRDLEYVHKKLLGLDLNSSCRARLVESLARDRRDQSFVQARSCLDSAVIDAARLIVRGWLSFPRKPRPLLWAALLLVPYGKRIVQQELARHW